VALVDAALELALLVLFLAIAGYALRLVVTASRGGQGGPGTVVDAIGVRPAAAGQAPPAAPPVSPALAEALDRLVRAVLAEPALPEPRRVEALDVLRLLRDAAASPPGQRRPGLVRAGVDLLSGLAAGAPDLERAWTTWGPVVRELLPAS
jgi:hypothetical protein